MKNVRTQKYTFGMIALLALLAALFVLGLREGSQIFSKKEFFGALFRKDGFEKQAFILWSYRLPRVLAAMLAGAGLSVAGLLLQNLTGNALAGPNIIGVNAGAGFMVIVCMYFVPESLKYAPLTAFAGAFLATVFIILIALKKRFSKSSVILSGVAVSALLNAGISMISLLDPDVLTAYNDFAVGGLSGIESAERLLVPFLLIFISCIFAIVISRDVDAMTLGEGMAASLGVRVGVIRVLCMLIASACAGAVVSFAGLIGFVGLMVPHIAKKLFGARTLRSMLASVLLGANLVCAADIIGRTLFRGTEIPVGIVMAGIGVPFFLWLMIGRRETN